MGLWNTKSGEALQPGQFTTVFSAETLSDADASLSVALPAMKSREMNIMWDIQFGSSPTTISYVLQVAMDDVEASFHDTGDSITNTAGGAVTLSNIVGRFARIKATDADVELVTARIMVA
jgi:hypothetical protein